MAPAKKLLALALLSALVILAAEAATHSKRRGLKASGLTDEEISEVLKQHDPHRVIHRHNNKDDLKHHPEVQKYMEWKQRQAEGHPEAGVAYSGNIPHEFLNHLLEHEGGELMAGPGAAGPGLGAGVKGPGRKAAHNDEL